MQSMKATTNPSGQPHSLPETYCTMVNLILHNFNDLNINLLD